MSNENQTDGKHKIDRFRGGATCRPLLTWDFDGSTNCVSVKLSCEECPISKRYGKEKSITSKDLNTIYTKAMAKAAKIK